ncbi:MAG: SGNH/GDSL hydrolase family protein [Tepidisphaeraceae bacterium]
MRKRMAAAWAAVVTGMLLAAGRCGAQELPVFPVRSTILFQGDSITDGNRGRSLDPNHILGHSYVFIIAAKCGAEAPDRAYNFLNRGISGNTVADLAKRWQKDTLDLKPAVLSILIGVNDLNKGVSAEDYRRQYTALLEETLKALPNVKLILGEPFGLPVGKKKEGWEAYRKQLEERQKIVADLGEKFHAPVVHFQQVFDAAVQRAPADYWIWDGVHPTYRGHQLMADEWVRVAREAFR